MPVSTASDLQANILKVLSAGGSPLSSSKIAKALPVGGRPSPAVLQALLVQLAEQGVLARTPGKTDKFVASPVESWARGKPADGVTQPDPLPHLEKALDALLAAVEAKGFPAAAVRAAALRHLGAGPPGKAATAPARVPATTAPATAAPAPSSPSPLSPAPLSTPPPVPAAAGGLSPDAIIAAMGLAEPRVQDGAAVSIARLREMLGARQDKKSFDDAVLTLAKRGVLELQSHAWPARLTVEQQQQLIDNGRGGWYDSAALQRRGS